MNIDLYFKYWVVVSSSFENGPLSKSEISFFFSLCLLLVFHFQNVCVFYKIMWPLQPLCFVMNGDFGELWFLYIGVLLRFGKKKKEKKNPNLCKHTLMVRLHTNIYLMPTLCSELLVLEIQKGKKIYIYYPPGQKFWWKPSDNWELGEKKGKYALC